MFRQLQLGFFWDVFGFKMFQVVSSFFFLSRNGGFHQWRIPISWVVYFYENLWASKKNRMWVAPWLRKPPNGSNSWRSQRYCGYLPGRPSGPVQGSGGNFPRDLKRKVKLGENGFGRCSREVFWVSILLLWWFLMVPYAKGWIFWIFCLILRVWFFLVRVLWFIVGYSSSTIDWPQDDQLPRSAMYGPFYHAKAITQTPQYLVVMHVHPHQMSIDIILISN